MPNYDYICEACGEEHEIFHSIKDSVKECPACKKEELKKCITAPLGIMFNGSGFYETDYRRKGKSESASATESSGGSCKHKSACACH